MDGITDGSELLLSVVGGEEPDGPYDGGMVVGNPDGFTDGTGLVLGAKLGDNDGNTERNKGLLVGTDEIDDGEPDGDAG
eukprot:CAMPEP_0116557228 /NCGR_PEP_ID=MMETSP0397-20121206/9121_1 /TAXON_ID=216820 /ORGANISM="Cyclophora tenuis, Strain ECT3854" /LENGTH=78 /DNA_ID=CAMNT_0004082657 /DNA_START=623 /DNA_END=859 /DNA_ORIENTATION=-